MTHDLKTPLNSMTIILDLLDKEDNIELVKEKLKIVKSNTQMLSFLVQDILDYS